MDNNILSIFSLSISVVGIIISIINHKRVKSTCCKKELSASFDVDSTLTENLINQ